MYTNFSPSPPSGVGVNRIDGVKPSFKEVNEQSARGEFSEVLTTQRAPATTLDDVRAVREALNYQAQTAIANSPFSAPQLIEFLSKNQQEAGADSVSDSEDLQSEPKPTTPANAKKEKQAKQFLDVANFSSQRSLFEIVI